VCEAEAEVCGDRRGVKEKKRNEAREERKRKGKGKRRRRRRRRYGDGEGVRAVEEVDERGRGDGCGVVEGFVGLYEGEKRNKRV